MRSSGKFTHDASDSNDSRTYRTGSKTRSTKLLRFVAAVSDAPLLEGADHRGQSVALLAIVQAGLAMLPEPRRFEPVQHEQGPVDASELLQGEIELVWRWKAARRLSIADGSIVPAFR